jgi:NTE family protein
MTASDSASKPARPPGRPEVEDRSAPPEGDPQSRRRRRWLAVAGLAALGVGSGAALAIDGAPVHEGAGLPAAMPLSAPLRVAWVFSSGGPRGFVHIGVLKALEALGLQADLLVGASVGAWVAVLHGAGLRATEIETLALDLQPWQLFRLSPFTPERLSGGPIARLVPQQAGRQQLQALRVPVACVAQRLPQREVVAFTQGHLGLAVQAATAIEGQLAPVQLNGQHYGDADLNMPLPVRVARVLGAQRVLAVDASAHEERAPPGTGHWHEGDRLKRALSMPDAVAADVLLHPDTGYYTGMSRAYRQACIDIGERETLAQAAALRRLHA